MITAILQFFGRILLFIYDFCHSYALTLALFTLLVKLVLFPLSYKGKQGMMRMNSLNTEMQRLQKQYGKDQQRYNLELQKLYEEEHVNPMSGCLWSLLPLPILMGLYYVIRKPMFYMLCLTNEQIEAVKNVVVNGGVSLDGVNKAYEEISILNAVSQNADLFTQAQSALGDAASKLQAIDFSFIGIDLGTVPQWQFWKWDSVDWNHIGLFLIPIFVTALNFFYSKFSMKSSQVKKNGEEDDSSNAATQSTQGMMLMMPLMYLWFGYIMPAGMCIYMACNAVFSALQELFFAKVLNQKFQQEEEERQARLAAKRNAEKSRKAEIAARRAAEEAELLKKGGKKALKQAQKKERKDSGAGALGVRKYARGRSYDPDRYPATTYRDPGDVDEEALEAALSKKGRKPESGAEDSED